MKNYIQQSIWFTLLLLVGLTGLSFLPDGISIGEITIRRMDIFSDVRKQGVLPPPVETEPTLDSSYYYQQDTLLSPDTLTSAPAEIPGPLPEKDSTYFGKAIEDYTFNQSGLGPLFSAVDSIKYGRTVRIAWYGDSFVEGDILLGDLRDTLQTKWGGAGVGFVPITSEVAQFKRTLRHQFHGFTAFSIIKKSNIKPRLGLNGYAYQPESDSRVTYEGASYFHHTASWTQFRLFYSGQNPIGFDWQLADKNVRNDVLPAKNSLGCWKWDDRFPGTPKISLHFGNADGLMLYGASLESGPGIYIDNFSVRGNSGGPLMQLHPDFMQEFNKFQHYDLIVLQVGLNAVTNGLTNIHWYEAELERTYKHLSACFPGTPILIVSVGDRCGKTGDELTTMRGAPAIVALERNLARKHGFLFYDLFWGMGGPNTMVRFANHHPRWANTDYTHLTHEGGREVGLMFAGILLNEQEKWKRSRPLN